MDDPTAECILRLLYEDSLELAMASKGKGREGAVSDEELALMTYTYGLERDTSFIADRRMARSMVRAVLTDGNIVTESRSLEQAAARDREIACRLGGHETTSMDAPWKMNSEEMDEELVAKMADTYLSYPGHDDDHNFKYHDTVTDDESPSKAASSLSNGKAIRTKSRLCVACQEYKKSAQVARAPCGHEYCRECLQDLFNSAMNDESLFPPRCCRQAINPSAVQMFLTTELVRQYEEKRIEFAMPNRTYCCAPRCSAFIRPKDIVDGDRAICHDCGMVTCTMCKALSHEGDCPADADLQLVLDTATENKWQRCSSCRRIVELDVGCNHITFVQ
ncbi:MAG: hypothetical protein M1818_002145 [Claussenomyces sp. TS43310]|nr:MAG: hypothetical protein M1818_002145 [Claussenomyces sp. TS43310]